MTVNVTFDLMNGNTSRYRESEPAWAFSDTCLTKISVSSLINDHTGHLAHLTNPVGHQSNRTTMQVGTGMEV